MIAFHKIYQIEIYPFIKMGRGEYCKHFDGQTSEMSNVKILPAEILHGQCVADPHHGVQHPRGPDVRSKD